MLQQPGGSNGAHSLLNPAIEALNLAEISSTTPGEAVFGPASSTLAAIRVYFLRRAITIVWLTITQDFVADEQDYARLRLSCVDVCQALDRGLSGKRSDHLSQSVLVAIGKLTT